LRIDLNHAAGEWIALPEPILRRYIGGAGLGVWLMLRENAGRIDPLAAAAPLSFVFSPLVGSPLTTSAKFAVVSRSPLTMRLNDSLASSSLALAGKKTGADAIVIVGRAKEPSILIIDHGEVRLEPAGDLWGAEIQTAEQALRERFDADYQFAVIGPAGERGVLFSTISHDGRHAGRGGAGAQLGAKNIKAVAMRGDRRVAWKDPTRLMQYAKDLSAASFGPATAKYRELGTAANMLVFNRLKALPTNNFQQGSFAGAAALSPEALAATHEKTRSSCAACTIGCEHIYSIPDAKGQPRGVRLEYENLFALGSLCGVSDPDVVLAASDRCDRLGLDTISTGGVIAFAMQCAEEQRIEAPWLRFGDGPAMLRAIEMIAQREEGLGESLAQGSKRFSEAIGHGAEKLAPHVKGLEIPGYEPRALQTMALGFAVGSRGADHNRSGAYEADFSGAVDRRQLTPAAAPLAIDAENRAALIDSLILCKFVRAALPDLYASSAQILQAITGWNLTAEELRASAAHIIDAKKAFNIQAGWTPSEDTLPERFLSEALSDDPQARLTAEQLSAAVAEYNRLRNWSPQGWLKTETQNKIAEDAFAGC